MDNEFQQEVREGFALMNEFQQEVREGFVLMNEFQQEVREGFALMMQQFKEMNERFEKKFEEIDKRLDAVENRVENLENYCRDNFFVLEQELQRKTDAILDKLDDNDRKFSENDVSQDKQIENHEYRLMKLELNNK